MTKKEEILEAAFNLFSQKGYNTSIADIAKRVGLKPSSIYSHFESKDEIIWTIIEKEMMNYYNNYDRIVESVKDKSLEEKLKAIFQYALVHFDSPDRAKFWRNITLIDNAEIIKQYRALLEKQNMKSAAIIQEYFKQGIAAGEIKTNTIMGSIYLFVEMIQGLNVMLLFNRNTEKMAEESWKAYWNGIKNND